MGVVYAYVSDVTEPNERAKSLGILGAAFGLGFLLGPVSGAFLVKFNDGHPYYLGAASALFGLINLLYVWRGMPDIPPADPTAASAGIAAQFRLVGRALRTPGLGLLLAIFFMINLGFSNLESTYFRLMENVYRLDQEQTALILTWVGIVSAFIQGYFIRKLLVRFSEVTLLRISYCILIPTFITVPFAQPWVPVLIGAFTNQWTMELAQDLRFVFEKDPSGNMWVQDQQPPRQRFEYERTNPPMDFVIISGSSIPAAAPLVIAAGLAISARSGGEFLTSASAMEEAFRNAPAGWERKNLQLVLRAEVLGKAPGPARVVALHVW